MDSTLVLHEDSELAVDNLFVSAWEDSDDERLTISLASYGQRRKLRDTEIDDVVSGTEYSRRLRRQYESPFLLICSWGFAHNLQVRAYLSYPGLGYSTERRTRAETPKTRLRHWLRIFRLRNGSR